MTKIKYIVISSILLYLLLLIPLPSDEYIKLAKGNRFLWNNDSLWNALELSFSKARDKECDSLSNQISKSLNLIKSKLVSISSNSYHPTDKIFDDLIQEIFYTSPIIAACPDSSGRLISLISRMRNIVKEQSKFWNVESIMVKDLLYQLLYGSRAAIEEIMLQAESDSLYSQIYDFNEKSITPSSNFMGVKIHSGDILISRGGAPTSALIARGSDYPGNFSHVALVYIDPKTSIPSIIESHIEIGVTVSTLHEYINDKKLRIMILRLRNDLPEIIDEGMIPHKAADYIMARAKAEHIPYDFEMDHKKADKLFCSEVVSSAYSNFNIELWQGLSSISSYGTAKLLAGFGVKNFTTQEPSDLEYDPNVHIVAEWRDLRTLYQDHVDNAAVDAIIDWVNQGNVIPENQLLLPIYRFVKLYSYILNQFGYVGPIPEGMSSEAALKHEAYSKFHSSIKEHILIEAEEFWKAYKYRAPYWLLTEFADGYFAQIHK